MSTLTYPSSTFPGFPAVVMDCPDGWSPRTLPEAQLAIVQERPEGEFRPNVVVVMQRMRPEQTVEAIIEEAVARFEATPGYEEVGRAVTTAGGLPSLRIEGAWTTPETGTLAQALRLVVAEHDGVRDVVEVTGTCAGHQVEEVWDEIRAVQDSVRRAER